jgi:hypothetical protein
MMDRFAERVSSAGLIEVGPEECDEPVAPVESPRPRDREVDQQRHSLRLGKDRVKRPVTIRAEVDRAQCA